MKMKKTKRAPGDRKDGKLLRNLDSLHFITGILYPNRCDNEAYISETVDLTALNAYIAKKNETETDFRYTLFHCIVAALAKTIILRPKLNRFVANCNFYQRNDVRLSFVVKKQFSDSAAEALAVLNAKEGDTLQTVHDYIREQVTFCRSDKTDSSTESMDLFNKLPRFVSKTAVKFICWLDKHGWVPASLIETDPYYTSCVISNLGSIKLKCGYHHLTNWGTCSLFCVIGEKKLRPIHDENGAVEMRETLDLGLTIDERLADGYYYSKSVRLLKKLLQEPELLEKPFGEKIEF
ncbi:MAG: 2-oxo acid dehydrogenase subunit E2 [Ruminococcaceae bacterium]|nr:2-oxo acid dehydrogenase subunit E2 [Oscillospiraceae bacterium]